MFDRDRRGRRWGVELAARLAKELPRYLEGKTLKAFEFENKGTSLSLGKGGSLAEVKGYFTEDIRIKGRLITKGTEEMISDLLERSIQPRLKMHG